MKTIYLVRLNKSSRSKFQEVNLDQQKREERRRAKWWKRSDNHNKDEGINPNVKNVYNDKHSTDKIYNKKKH